MPERTHTTRRQIAQQKRRARDAGEKQPEPNSHWRPKTRGDCIDLPRPCPYYGCRYHIGLDVTHAGSVRMPFGDKLEAMEETCALDVAERGNQTLTKMGLILNYNKERVRQVLIEAMDALKTTMLVDQEPAQAPGYGAGRFAADDAIDAQAKEPLAKAD